MREILLHLVFLGLIPLGSARNDVGLIPNGKGILLAESVAQRIQASCIFSDDKLLLRHIAYVETADGTDPETYRDGYHGGMWKVDSSYFQATKSVRADKLLLPYKNLIKDEFSVDWRTLSWNDCRKPLISALAARLYIEFKSRHESNGIPRDIESQATFWKSYYRPDGNKEKFISLTTNLDSAYKRAGSADVVFVIDGSGSISLHDFDKIKEFLKDVVNALETEQDRFGLIQFSHKVRTEFNLNTYNTTEDIIRAIDRVESMGESTETFLALEQLPWAFSKKNGGRGIGASKVAIVVTDGRSSNNSRTVAAAKKLQDSGVIVMTIGVTDSTNIDELMAITSQPTCLHLVYLSEFHEFKSLKYTIERRALQAPVVLWTDMKRTTIPADHSLNVQLKIPPGESTFIFHTDSGNQSTVYLANKTFPSPLFYEKKLISTPDRSAVLRVKNPSSATRLVFANLASSKDKAVISRVEISHKDLPCINPERNGLPVKITIQAGRSHFGKLIVPTEGVTLSLFSESGEECIIKITEHSRKYPYKVIESTPKKSAIAFVQYTGRPLYFNATGSQNHTTSCILKPEVGDKRQCTSNPCVNGLCTEEPYGFLCVCKEGFIGKRCDSVRYIQRFDCAYQNPCTLRNIEEGNVLFAHRDNMKYVQCRGEKQCFENSCLPGSYWNTDLRVCVCSKRNT